MNLQDFLPYAPVILVVMAFFISYKIFVTPADLTETEKAILKEVENRFATKEIVNALKEDITEVKKKVNDIYDFLIKQGK